MSVFEGVYAGGYDSLYKDKNYGAECDLVERAFQRAGAKPGGRLLDVGCGTGGHAIELARRGHRVTGVDLSPHMIKLAREKAAAHAFASQIDWCVADARSFEASGPFDGAIMMFAVLGYLNANRDVLAGLANIRRHLAPGAPFVCDFWYGPAVLTQRPGDRVRIVENEGQRIIRATHTALDVNASRADVHFDVIQLRGDRLVSETREVHSMRYFFASDLELLLERAGFELVSLSAFPDLDQPLSAETWNAFAVARAV